MNRDPRLLRTVLGGSGFALVVAVLWISEPWSSPASVSVPALLVPDAPQPRTPFELEPVRPTHASPAKVEVAALLGSAFAEQFASDVRAVGSLSIGAANRGQLFNAVQLQDGPHWEVVEPKFAWGTEETVRALENAISEVNRLYPGSPRLFVGHLSRSRGGWLRPHRSHQSGRDVDLGFYYSHGGKWYLRATPDNLDAARTWALLSAMHKASPLEYAFIDRSLHPLLRAEAERVEEPAELIATMFDGDVMNRPILRHARGHDDHIHVRFASPVAVEGGQRARAQLGRAAQYKSTMLAMLEQRARKAEARGAGEAAPVRFQAARAKPKRTKAKPKARKP